MFIPLQIRPFRPEDQAKILVLFCEVFGSTRTPEWWEWQVFKNPVSRAIVWLAETEEKELVGYYSLIPVSFWQKGKIVKAGFSIHSMVHPQFQRQGILKRLAEAAEKQLSEDSIETCLTFLNKNSFFLYTQRLGWREMRGGLPVFFSVLDTTGIIRRFVKFNGLARVLAFFLNPFMKLCFCGGWFSKRAINIKQVRQFDERVNNLWQKIRQSVLFTTDRNCEYLNWRFTSSPYPYKIFVLETEDNELLGAVVTRVEEKFSYRFGYIADLLFPPTRPEVGVGLVRHVFGFLKEQHCAMVTALATEPVLKRVLRKGGFYRLPSFLVPHEIHFCCKDRSPRNETENLIDPEGWYLSWSDHDVV